MIYLDFGATSFQKPPAVFRAAEKAMRTCANPGRGGYPAAMAASQVIYDCREAAAALFSCRPEQVVLTTSCTHGLNIAIHTLVKPGDKVVISGFEHNAVTRPLHALGANVCVAGRRLFDWDNMLEDFDRALKGADAAVFTHVSNVFGYILPVGEMAAMCRRRGIPFIIDAAQSAGTLPVNFSELGADFIAMPGHKGLLGLQGTGLLLCARKGEPLLLGGTGSQSIRQEMPEELPERLEAGTMNVPGYAGLTQGLRYVKKVGTDKIFAQEQQLLALTVRGLAQRGFRVFAGEHQAATVSFLPGLDCEEAAQRLARQNIAVRAGLHCAPLAHESAGTLKTGTVRVSVGCGTTARQIEAFLRATDKFPGIQ
ncbi:MAG: aminotransferase class V-fold PLP-dependent enzyme [Candidatus Faecousia sp.]|nr:aminotransferase class V-fold PLP-dependent enzyme [Candidatus Faecousia sp.]